MNGGWILLLMLAGFLGGVVLANPSWGPVLLVTIGIVVWVGDKIIHQDDEEATDA